MVEAASQCAQTKAELVTFAQSYIDRWDEFADAEFTSSEFGFDFTSRQTDYNGNILTVSKASVPGLTHEKHGYFRDNIKTMLPSMDDKITVLDAGEIEGNSVIIQNIKMPMIMSNRSIAQIFYLDE